MKHKIVKRWDGAVIFEADVPDELTGGLAIGEALRQALKANANLSGADLSGADLSGANLRNANLRDANLRNANLRDAVGLAADLTTPMTLLADQPGKMRLYKLVEADGTSPIHSRKLTYRVGESIGVADADTNPANDCGAGINVASLDWCLRNWTPGRRILLAEFVAADIACIPIASDGKVRLHRCTIVGEKTFDPVALGLAKAEEAKP